MNARRLLWLSVGLFLFIAGYMLGDRVGGNRVVGFAINSNGVPEVATARGDVYLWSGEEWFHLGNPLRPGSMTGDMVPARQWTPPAKPKPTPEPAPQQHP